MNHAERAFQQNVVDLAHRFGYLVLTVRPVPVRRGMRTYHETPFGADGKGWPDCTMVRPRDGRMVCAELKVGANKPEPDQERWRVALGSVPCVEHYIWWPHDWENGTIEGVLR